MFCTLQSVLYCQNFIIKGLDLKPFFHFYYCIYFFLGQIRRCGCFFSPKVHVFSASFPLKRNKTKKTNNIKKCWVYFFWSLHSRWCVFSNSEIHVLCSVFPFSLLQYTTGVFGRGSQETFITSCSRWGGGGGGPKNNRIRGPQNVSLPTPEKIFFCDSQN